MRGRDERLVERVLAEAFRASLDPYRPQQPLPEDGYKLQIDYFALLVTRSKRLPGEEIFTYVCIDIVLITCTAFQHTRHILRSIVILLVQAFPVVRIIP